jgi:hypothetical protein
MPPPAPTPKRRPFALLPDDQLRFLHGPIIGFVGTRNRALRPSVSWASAIRADAAADAITFLLPELESEVMLANIADNGLIALTVLEPKSHESYQYKGRFLSKRPGNSDDEALSQIQQAKAGARIDEMHLPGELYGRVMFLPGTAVTFRVEEIFDQTPGPNAGKRLAFARIEA